MADQINPYLSNGTCYWSAGQVAGITFVPCGNAAIPEVNFACCSLGDNCLSNGACYNGLTQATYIAGCTDPSFNATACTSKGEFDNQQWVGLIVCPGEGQQHGKAMDWMGCQEDSSLDQIANVNMSCKCDTTKTPLFTDNPTLTNIARLPLISGESLSYFPGHEPTQTRTFTTGISDQPSLTSTQTPASSTLSASTPSLPDPGSVIAPSTTANTSDSGMPLGTKVGIGAAAGIAIIFGFVAALAVYFRKRRQRQCPTSSNQPSPASEKSSCQPSWKTGDEDPAGQLCSGFKAELAADGAPSSALISPLSPASPQFSATPSETQYRAYNPEVHGNYSARYSAVDDTLDNGRGLVIPYSTGSPEVHRTEGSSETDRDLTARVAELEG